MDDVETKVAVLTERVDNLQEIVIAEKRRLNGNLEQIHKRLIGLGEKFDTVKSETLSKPSWGVAIAISTLLSAVVGLGTYLLTH